MIYIKRGVVLASLQQTNLLEPAIVADKLWHEKAWGHVWITSGIESNHMRGSYHYGAGKARRGQATDIRGPLGGKKFYATDEAVRELRKLLPKWRVILEQGTFAGATYFWIHFQPKPKER